MTSRAVAVEQVCFAVMAHDFQQGLVGAVDVLEFQVQDRVDPVLPPCEPKAILPTKPREQRAVFCGCLAVKVDLCRPPSQYSILEFRCGPKEPISSAWFGQD